MEECWNPEQRPLSTADPRLTPMPRRLLAAAAPSAGELCGPPRDPAGFLRAGAISGEFLGLRRSPVSSSQEGGLLPQPEGKAQAAWRHRPTAASCPFPIAQGQIALAIQQLRLLAADEVLFPSGLGARTFSWKGVKVRVRQALQPKCLSPHGGSPGHHSQHEGPLREVGTRGASLGKSPIKGDKLEKPVGHLQVV